MCITQIWTYRECGCQYHHPVPCHPSIIYSPSIPRRRRTNVHLSNTSSSSDRPPISTNSSTFNSSDPLPGLSRQCSTQHVVHKNFLEPICDDCLLEELGLQPELGPILGGRDLQEGFHGEEWILESSVEIHVEDSDDDRVVSPNREDVDDEAADADDEGEFRGRGGRRRGLEINRDALRISSDLSLDEQELLTLFREQLHGAETEGRTIASTAAKAQKEDRRLKACWSQHIRENLSKGRNDNKRPTSTSPSDDGSMNSSQRDIVPPSLSDHDHELGAGATSIETDPRLPSPIQPEFARDTSLNAQDQMTTLYEITHRQDTEEDASYPSWPQHLKADLQERQVRRTIDLAAAVPNEATVQECPRSPSSIRSSPQTATRFNSASWAPPNLQALGISSSEFDKKDDTTISPQPSSQPNHHAHTASTTSTVSTTSTFCTAHSTPSSPSLSSTRPTTATSATPQLSLHPLSTTLCISTPHRPALTPRTSSLRSPPASSPLLHSTPPLRQSPTGVFVCEHERWAFRGCGCEGPSWVRSCVCDDADGRADAGPAGEDGEARLAEAGDGEDAEDAKDACRAAEPIVRTRWFFNPTCEACEAAVARGNRKGEGARVGTGEVLIDRWSEVKY